MTYDQMEIQNAAERLRSVAYAECDEDMHQHADDCKLLAHAYLAIQYRIADLERLREAVEEFQNHISSSGYRNAMFAALAKLTTTGDTK